MSHHGIIRLTPSGDYHRVLAHSARGAASPVCCSTLLSAVRTGGILPVLDGGFQECYSTLPISTISYSGWRC